jgi:hypothetical protein
LDSHNDCASFAHRFVANEKKTGRTESEWRAKFGPVGGTDQERRGRERCFFRSLELVQKNLESLITRAEGMEHRLQSLMLHSVLDKREQYTAAALLLAEGHEAEWVTSMLNLPTAQVQLIHDLQQVTAREKRAATRPRNEEPFSEETARPLKTAGVQKKTAARPILLVDVIESAANETVAPDDQLSCFEGARV